MSTQAYTNKRRIIAEASQRKTQYPGFIGLNNNPIYASINCRPDFSEITYSHIQRQKCCIISSSGLSSILDGENSRTASSIVLDGGNATTDSRTFFDGGKS